MQFSNFTRTEDGSKIFFKTERALQGVTQIKYYKDNSSGSFSKKEFRWSFDGNYWSSWESLNQGNISGIDLTGKTYLFLEMRYTSSGTGEVTTFTLNYEGAAQLATDTESCPPDSDYVPLDKSVPQPAYDPTCAGGASDIDATTLCGKSCDYYLWRPNHKGQQPISSITDLQSVLNNLTGSIQNSITGGENVDGNGIGVYYDKEDQNLLFKRIDASNGIAISESSEGIISLSLDGGGAQDPSITELYEFYNELSDFTQDLSVYVDQKFFEIDSSLDVIRATYIPDVSLGPNFSWLNGILYVDASGSSGVTYLYVDGSLAARDASITHIFEWNEIQDASIAFLDSSINQIFSELFWTDPDSISADVGGWVGGDDVSVGANSIEILEKMLYEYFPPRVFNFNSSTHYFEKYNPYPNTDISVNGDFDNANFVKIEITDASIFQDGAGILSSINYGFVTDGSFGWNIPGDPGFADHVYSVKIYNVNSDNLLAMQPYEVSVGRQYVHPYYAGVVGDISIGGITNDTITGLSKVEPLGSKESHQIDFDVSANYVKIKFIYAYPYDYGELKSIFDIKNDFNVTTSFDDTSINISGPLASPWTQSVSYRVYLKSHWISFTPDVSTFKLIFNI